MMLFLKVIFCVLLCCPLAYVVTYLLQKSLMMPQTSIRRYIMDKGLFITLEGPDGSGKSTQIEYLREYFHGKGIETVLTREPGGTEIGEKLRDIILDKGNCEMCDMTEALLYAASRAQHVNQLIKPALEAGKVVVCDRFIDSSIAYQGYGRKTWRCSARYQ